MDRGHKHISGATSNEEDKDLNIEVARIHQYTDEAAQESIQETPIVSGGTLESVLKMEESITEDAAVGHLREPASEKGAHSHNLEQVLDDVHHIDEFIHPEILPAPNMHSLRHSSTADIEITMGNGPAGKNALYI